MLRLPVAFFPIKMIRPPKIGSRRWELDCIVLASLFGNCDQPVQKVDADPVLVAGGVPRRFGSRRCPNAGTPEILPAMGGCVGRSLQHWTVVFAGLALEAHLFLARRIICQLATAVPADNIGVIGLVSGLSHRRGR
jgi:hypothetical protein